MTALRQQMIEAMQQHGLFPQEPIVPIYAPSLIWCVTHRPPDQLNKTDLQSYFCHLVRRRYFGNASCRLYPSVVASSISQVLSWLALIWPLPLPNARRRPSELTNPARKWAQIIAALS